MDWIIDEVERFFFRSTTGNIKALHIDRWRRYKIEMFLSPFI